MLEKANIASDRFVAAPLRFSGRASREEFWWVVVVLFFTFALIALLAALFVGESFLDNFAYLILLSVAAGPFFVIFGLTTRRLHDVGLSGLWQVPLLLLAVSWPGVGLPVFFLLLMMPGKDAHNKYGEKPLPLRVNNTVA